MHLHIRNSESLHWLCGVPEIAACYILMEYPQCEFHVNILVGDNSVVRIGGKLLVHYVINTPSRLEPTPLSVET